MTRMEQTSAVEQFGYTRREAEFLVTAALHSGYFVVRQFHGVPGKVVFSMVRKILAYEHGSATTHANGLRLIHLSGKPLYAALGQEDNRHRRPRDPVQVRLKLMALDYVLQNPDSRFLPTEQEKMEYFTSERGLSEGVLPSKVYAGKGSNTRRYFIDKMPIRIDADGSVSFCYIDDGVFIAYYFHTWLEQYSRLIAAIPGSNLVYIAPELRPLNPPSKRRFRPPETRTRLRYSGTLPYENRWTQLVSGEKRRARLMPTKVSGRRLPDRPSRPLSGMDCRGIGPAEHPARPIFEEYKLPFTYPVYQSVLTRRTDASG